MPLVMLQRLPVRRRREGTSDDSIKLRCLSCNAEYAAADDSGTCRDCCVKMKEKKESLKNKVEELKFKLSFLKLPSPVLYPFSTDIILLPIDDSSASPIPAHKAILVSRSPVFKVMLENDTIESRSGTIKIPDVSYDTLCAFVNYLYTAEASLDDDQTVCNLLALGEKYQVKQLKINCEQHLVAKINWDKSIEHYAFAYQYNCKSLLQASLDVIMDNMPRFTQHDYYPVLMGTNPQLVVDIYDSYLLKKIKSGDAP
ncbi:hypothetical protein VNO77_30419 [Canavalia gladiata]|uniref:BTB domain-containing protein n=1 Tax=Canavalia gladiata TaxID=3824 RepID=A0AAN9Q780_CANGL